MGKRVADSTSFRSQWARKPWMCKPWTRGSGPPATSILGLAIWLGLLPRAIATTTSILRTRARVDAADSGGWSRHARWPFLNGRGGGWLDAADRASRWRIPVICGRAKLVRGCQRCAFRSHKYISTPAHHRPHLIAHTSSPASRIPPASRSRNRKVPCIQDSGRGPDFIFCHSQRMTRAQRIAPNIPAATYRGLHVAFLQASVLCAAALASHFRSGVASVESASSSRWDSVQCRTGCGWAGMVAMPCGGRGRGDTGAASAATVHISELLASLLDGRLLAGLLDGRFL